MVRTVLMVIGPTGPEGPEGKPGEMWAIPCFTLPHRRPAVQTRQNLPTATTFWRLLLVVTRCHRRKTESLFTKTPTFWTTLTMDQQTPPSNQPIRGYVVPDNDPNFPTNDKIEDADNVIEHSWLPYTNWFPEGTTHLVEDEYGTSVEVQGDYRYAWSRMESPAIKRGNGAAVLPRDKNGPDGG